MTLHLGLHTQKYVARAIANLEDVIAILTGSISNGDRGGEGYYGDEGDYGYAEHFSKLTEFKISPHLALSLMMLALLELSRGGAVALR